VFVDIAVDECGFAVTSRATTHENPTYFEDGVLHYCVANMPGAYSRTATQALNNVSHAWTQLIAEYGVEYVCRLFLKSPCGKGRVCGRTSLRRDEGVDEHPQPKNNAKIGVRRPER